MIAPAYIRRVTTPPKPAHKASKPSALRLHIAKLWAAMSAGATAGEHDYFIRKSNDRGA